MRPARACRPGGSLGFVFFPPRPGALSEKASASAAQRRCAYTRLSTSRARPALCVAGRSRGPCPTVWAASAVRAGNGGPRGHRGSGRGGDHLRLARRIPVHALRFLCAAHRSVSRPPVCLSTLGGPFLTPQSGVQLAHSVCWRVRPQGRGPHTACAPRPLPPPGRGWHCTPWRRPAWAASPAPRAAVPSGSGRSPASPPVQAARACLLPGAFGA